MEPATIRPGRCSLRQALGFLTEHRTDPDEVGSAESIARRFNLDVKRVNNVLLHFSIFNVEKPQKALSELAGYKNETETQFSMKVSPDMTTDTYKKAWSEYYYYRVYQFAECDYAEFLTFYSSNYSTLHVYDTY